LCTKICFCVLLVRPEFADTLAVKHGKHPIMDRISLEPLVPNSVVSSFILLYRLHAYCIYVPFCFGAVGLSVLR